MTKQKSILHPVRNALALLVGVLLMPVLAANELKKETFQAGPWEDEFGYRQAVKVGRTVYISGSVGGGEMPKAINSAYGTIKKSLEAFGLDFRHVVKETIFTTDIEALKAYHKVRMQFYGKDFPASSWIQVSRLFEPGYVIEVEVIAVMPE